VIVEEPTIHDSAATIFMVEAQNVVEFVSTAASNGS